MVYFPGERIGAQARGVIGGSRRAVAAAEITAQMEVDVRGRRVQLGRSTDGKVETFDSFGEDRDLRSRWSTGKV